MLYDSILLGEILSSLDAHSACLVPRTTMIVYPVLFALFTNDLSSVLQNCQFLVFADDIKLLLRIESSSDCELLHSGFNALVTWSRQLGLKLLSVVLVLYS